MWLRSHGALIPSTAATDITYLCHQRRLVPLLSTASSGIMATLIQRKTRNMQRKLCLFEVSYNQQNLV